MFELRQLEQLLTIAEYGTISKAAEKSFISQPSLSRSMQKLEQELGVPLFVHKQKNRLTLNKNGELAVDYARMLLTQASDMEQKLRAFDRAQNTISLGSCAPAPVWQLVPYLSARYPGMAISSEIQEDAKTLINGLLEEIYRLIVTVGPVSQEHICSVPYFSETLFLAVPADHELAVYDNVYLKDLKNLTIILTSNLGFWYELCQSQMVDPNFILIDKFEDYTKLVNTTTLPCFLTQMNHSYFSDNGVYAKKGWKIIHILDEDANVMYYCSCLETNKKYLPDVPIQEINGRPEYF